VAPIPALTFPRPPALRIVTALALVGVLTACGSGGTTGTDTASGEPVSGGNLTIGTYLDPTCIDNQQIGSNVSLSITRQLVDSLTDQDPQTGQIEPWLATSWEVDDDATSYTFHLRDDVTFSDGSVFDAQVVKDNLDGIVALGASAPVAGPYLTGLSEVTVLDDRTVEVDFTQSNVQFLEATATIAMGMVSATTAGLSADERCAQGVIGSGPFVLDSYTANESAVISKRSGYAWGSPVWDSQGEAYLDQVTFQVLPEDSVRSGSLRSGQVDAIDSVAQQDEAALSSGGFRIVTRANPGFAVSVLFNLDSPVGSDPAVRQAMLLGVDRDDVLTVLGPTGSRTEGLLSPTTPGANDFSLTYDAERAAQILDAAGWTTGSDGIREKDGQRLTLDFPYFFDGAVAELLQQEYASIGIELDIRQVTTADFITALSGGAFDATIGNLTRADIDVLRSVLTNDGANYYRFGDDDLQTLLEQQAAETDPTERESIADRIQTLVLDNAYVVPLHSLDGTYAVSDAVHDLKFEASTRLLLHDTWTDAS